MINLRNIDERLLLKSVRRNREEITRAIEEEVQEKGRNLLPDETDPVAIPRSMIAAERERREERLQEKRRKKKKLPREEMAAGDDRENAAKVPLDPETALRNRRNPPRAIGISMTMKDRRKEGRKNDVARETRRMM